MSDRSMCRAEAETTASTKPKLLSRPSRPPQLVTIELRHADSGTNRKSIHPWTNAKVSSHEDDHVPCVACRPTNDADDIMKPARLMAVQNSQHQRWESVRISFRAKLTAGPRPNPRPRRRSLSRPEQHE